MVRQGESLFYSTEGSGRYGVGGKDVAISLWGTEQIISFNKNQLGMMEITWDDICEQDYPPMKQRWYSLSEVSVDFLKNENINFKSGTRIVYRDIGISRIQGFQAKKRRIADLFSEEILIERNNNEPANKLGNLISRVSTLIEKYEGLIK
jgi:hypothetical protein